MFDISFWELAIVGVVALLVVGPDRLPGLARTAGLWVGRARRFVSTVKADIDREIRAEELKEILNKQNEFKGAFDILEETRKDVGDAVSQLNDPLMDVEPPASRARPAGSGSTAAGVPAPSTEATSGTPPATPRPVAPGSTVPAEDGAGANAPQPSTESRPRSDGNG